MIELRCPACKQSIKLDESFTGRRVACVGCAKEFAVPDLKQRAAAKSASTRPVGTKSPAMSVAMPAKPEPTLLDAAKRHRDKVVVGLVAGVLGIAAMVIYMSMRGGSGDEQPGTIAATDGNAESPTDRGQVAVDQDQNATDSRVNSGKSSTNNSTSGNTRQPADAKVTPRPNGTTPPAVADTKPPKTNTTKTDTTKPPQPPATTIPSVSSATYTSPKGVLLRHSNELNDWITVARDTEVPAGTRLALPAPFSAQFDVGPKLYSLRLIGGTVSTLLEPTEEAPFGFELHRGRQIVMGARESEMARASLTLAVAGESWHIELLKANTVFGVEILPRRPETFEQDFGKDDFTGGIIVVKGSVRVTDAAQRTRVIAGNSWLSLAHRDRIGEQAEGDEPPPRQLPEPQFRAMPDWLDLDKLASQSEENPDAALFESLFNRQQEFGEAIEPLLTATDAHAVALAVACQSLLSQRSNLIGALATTRQAEVRQAALEGLREQMPATKENREKFKQELAAGFDKGAEAIYALLWGYAGQDIRKNQFTCFQLVSWLTHDELVVRELAWAQITAHATARYAYKPTASLRIRRATAKHWQQHVLKTGSILGEELR